ncbi:hypothetical protein [Actinoplanes sp. M2I2]|uniref:hypothetical protein n=1 Tax=Actinoplanes sp. M2I2 TaxID=1734444 RepID=UPI0020201D06|nr:hypothetical protein [Actinoplanes sp. M2I2]
MVFPYVPAPGAGGPAGETYAAALVRTSDAGGVTQVLRSLRFTGWIVPAQDGWVPVLAVPGSGTLAAGRRGIAGVGAALAEQLGVAVVAVRVLADRQLVLVAWSGAEELGRYVSDPAREPGADEDVLDEPFGVGAAGAIAAACGHPGRGGDLTEILADELDPESVIESERLSRVLRLLELPTWLVAVAALPRDVPTGPAARELTRLGWGVPGAGGVVAARLARVVRRRRRPPPVLADPPRGSGMDPWLM